MTAINDNMDDTQRWLPLTTADAKDLANGFYQLDDEYVEVAAGFHEAPLYDVVSPLRVIDGKRVARGMAGSTAVTHTSGATLTPYYPDAPSGGGGGGGGAQVLDPFSVAWNDAGLFDNGVNIGPVLAADTLVLFAWIKPTTIWVGSGHEDFYIGVGDAAGSGSWDTVMVKDQSAMPDVATRLLGIDFTAAVAGAIARTGDHLLAYVTAGTDGAFDVYALIYAPA